MMDVERHVGRLVGDVLASLYRRLDQDCLAIERRHDLDTALDFRAEAEAAIEQGMPGLTEWIRQTLARERHADS